MKVHVTLERLVASDPVARRLVFYRVLAAGQIVPGNPGRFAKHGIITGEIRPDRLDQVRAVPGVEAVEVDEEELAGSRHW
ncbi:MAG TPA: hypothetical protein VMX54_06055 [Vicinamibacteria bacterium]|nr:hypothetical protein [Vicinamibacteria bacterium]